MQQAWPERPYLGLHAAIELLVAVAAFATFAVQWYAAGARLNDARARFLGAAFLTVGCLEVAHLLAFPGMPGLPWLQSSTERGIVYWLAARTCGLAALLGALAIPPASGARALRRGPLLAFALGVVALALVTDLAWISRTPRFFVEGAGLTPLKRAVEITFAAAAAVGLAAYRRVQVRRADPNAGDLALALGLTALSELSFALYARAYDSFNLAGHLYLLLATGWVFHALFVEAVLRPHADLQRLRAHVANELEVTIRDLRALEEQREDFLRSVSHDLRTPLQTVMLQADRLIRIASAGSREQKAAESVARAARQMNGLIRDLVDSIYLETGALHVCKEPLALGPFLGELLGVGGGPLEAERFALEIPGDLPPVPADAARLTRVVQNLAGNALRYAAAGSTIRVDARREADEVVVSIADRGPGVAPDDLPRIFDRFFRGAQRGKSEGLGLGLYISRLIVAAHGGRIWCESTVGEGSTFRFALPLHAGAAADGAREPPSA
jgi:signal transduction histidine kinase